jgi:hypothetical protein
LKLIVSIIAALLLAASGCGGGDDETDKNGGAGAAGALTDTGASVKEIETAQKKALAELSSCLRASGAFVETYQEEAARHGAPEKNELGIYAWYGDIEARHYASATFGDPGVVSVFAWGSSDLSAEQRIAVEECVAPYETEFE